MEHAVIVNLPLSDNDLGTARDDEVVEALDESIRTALADGSSGNWDGHEFGGGWARIFCYGANADVLFEALASTLLSAEVPRGTFVVKRYGFPGSSEQIIQLSAGAA